MPHRDAFLLIAASAVAAVCVMPTTAGFQRGSDGKIMWENSCNFSGTDCRSMKAIPAVCGDVCARESTCTDWIWNNYNGGTCWFKNGENVKWATNCVSTQVPPKAQVPAGAQVSAGARVPAGAQVPQVPAGTQASQIPAGTQAPQVLAGTQASQVPARGQVPTGVQVPSRASYNSGLSAAEMSEMLSRINAYRAQNGLSALTVDNRLVASSSLHSKDQASQCIMTHISSNGSRLANRITAQGYSFATVAENVAAGQATVEDVMTSWWNSPRHRANILRNDVVNVGFAKAVNTGCNSHGTYWTQDFGRLD